MTTTLPPISSVNTGNPDPQVTDGNGVKFRLRQVLALLQGKSGALADFDSTGSLLSATGDVAATGALGSLSAVVSVPMAGRNSVGFHLAAGTLAATVVPVISYDGGLTWLQTKFYDQVQRALLPFYVLTNPNGVLNATILVSGGVTHAGVQVSLYTSGTAAATVTGTVESEEIPPDRGGSVTFQSAANSTGNGTSMNVRGYASAVLTITGVFSATVFFEGSEDSTNGTDGTWVSINGSQLGAFNIANNATASGDYVVACSGLSWIRARVTWVSGTSVTITGHPSQNPWTPHQIAALLVQLIEGENQTLHRMMTAPSWNDTEITTATTTVVKTGAGILGSIIIPTGVASATIKVFDNTAASGTVLLGTFTVPATPVNPYIIPLGIAFSTGLTVVTAVAAQNVYVLWV